MCGITGIIHLPNHESSRLNKINAATQQLEQRGPDAGALLKKQGVALGHRRLSILDLSQAGNQPITDSSGRYTIVFNGEIYNFAVHRKILLQEGISFNSNTDTEVLLQLYIKHGKNCLEKLNGFFAFAIWDDFEKSLFIARDRMGIKPLYYWYSDTEFIFGSELKALLEFDIPKNLDKSILFTYLQLNYIPAPATMLEGVHKLEPGHYLEISTDTSPLKIKPERYYEIPTSAFNTKDLNPSNYATAQKTLVTLLDNSVKNRMISDVPLGTFLSGGIDSSIISSLASRHTDQLNTFSIGFQDNEFYDETHYAELVAKKIGSNHHSFKLNNNDFLDAYYGFLNYLDEPFADSSALNVFILSRETRKHVTVALSGDGADELFSGYNKHFAEFKVRNKGLKELLAVQASPLLKKLPQSRDGKLSNFNRQIQRFSQGASLSNRERYWQWATFRTEEHANYLLKEALIEKEQRLTDEAYRYKKYKEGLLQYISKTGNFNEVLYTDSTMLLPNDMLHKVDSMSMANSLEVRTPFLDHEIVNFAFQIPVEFKINHNTRKKILKDAFSNLLPQELQTRPKQGFEIPLLNWFKTDLNQEITDNYLNKNFIEEQGIFNPTGIERELKKLHSKNPGDVAGTIWNLITFQHWYKKYLS
jgi:asparagine synthase (glutamine-hydrolysing)